MTTKNLKKGPAMQPPFDPVDFKSAYYSDTAISMFIAAQFTTAKL